MQTVFNKQDVFKGLFHINGYLRLCLVSCTAFCVCTPWCIKKVFLNHIYLFLQIISSHAIRER